MPYRPEKLRWRGDFFRANGRWPSTAEMHSAFDDDVPETPPNAPRSVPEDSPNETPETSPSAPEPASEKRSPPSRRGRWSIWTGFL